jgi:hypothetical protein
MPIVKIEFNPGINREGTPYSEERNWYDCDKVRFRNGRPEKIGGWVKATQDSFLGVVRVMHNWTTLSGKDCIAIGTSKKFYVENSGAMYNITPVIYTEVPAANDPIETGAAGTFIHTLTTANPHGASIGDTLILRGITEDCDGLVVDTYTNPFTTGLVGSKVVTVNTVTAHFASVGDDVVFSGGTGFAGIPTGDFTGTYTVLEVVSSTSYKISLPTACTSGGTTGGGSITAKYFKRINRRFEILSVPTASSLTFATDKPSTTGAQDVGGATCEIYIEAESGFAYNTFGGGWGSSYWSRGPWGSGIVSPISGISLRIWSVDNYGEDLIFCRRDGSLFYWDASVGFEDNNAVLVETIAGANAVPSQVSIVRVTEDRHVLAIGATNRLSGIFDPLLVRWSSQENYLEWEPSITTTAGALRIPLGSYVVAAQQARQETLVWTNRSLHSIQFVGPPYTFGIQTLAENVNIAGPNATVNANNVTYWMGVNKFWMYTGRVESMPCTVQRFVFDNINFNQLPQTYAFSNPLFSEITWFYCDKTSQEINRYVTYNYEQKIWTVGSMARTAMVFCAARNGLPYGASGGYTNDDGALYVHETGYDDGSTSPASPITAYIESADFGIDSGNKIMFADRVIPDVTFARSTVDDPTIDVTIQAKKFPGQDVQTQDARTVAKSVTATVDQFTNQVWARLRGREMRLRFSSTGLGVSWLLGTIRVNLRNDGRQ